MPDAAPFSSIHFANLFGVQLVAYLIGSIPFGFLIARWAAGIDIRQVGSGNIGATNVGRALGFRFFVLVFFLDLVKGVVPVGAAQAMQYFYGDARIYNPIAVWYLPEAAGLAAILGHVFPIYLGFKGGKGVATSIGVLLLLAPTPVCAGLLAWLIVAGLTRMVSAASIGFAVAFAAAYCYLEPNIFRGSALARSVFVYGAAALIIIRHYPNIVRILGGSEPRIGRSVGAAAQRATEPPPAA